MTDKIQLRLEIKDGKKYIVDQHGREIEGVISFATSTEAGSLDEMTLTVYEFKDGSPLCSGGHQ